MSLRHYPKRFLLVTIATSLLLLSSTAGIGVYLNAERARTSAELRESIGSRRAAAALEETLTDLLALRDRGVQEVPPLHERVGEHLAEIQRYANKDRERELAQGIEVSFNRYLELEKRV